MSKPRERIKWQPKHPFYPLGEFLYPDVQRCGFCEKEMWGKKDRFAFLINYDPVRPCCNNCAEDQGLMEID